jgi:hypothetical protein
VALRYEPTRRIILIETNTNPALHTDGVTLTDLLPRLVDGALDLVLTSNLPVDSNSECGGVKSREQFQTDLPSQYELLFDEAR